MEMSTTKTVAVFAVIFGCFAILYPRIFHPMVLHALGLAQQPAKSSVEDMIPKLPPNLPRGGGGSSRNMNPDDVTRHLKAGPHPGLRAAAEMRKQTSTTGTGKGMMTIVLPMYAVGIVVYLVYTLSKVFGRKEKSGDGGGGGSDYLDGHFQKQNVRYDPDLKKFVPNMPEHEESDEDEEFKTYRMRKKEQRDLERLLLKADKNDISQVELLDLKRKLLETESQMSRILSAMTTIEDRMGPEGVVGNMQQEEEGVETQEQELPKQSKVPVSMDSSPDMDSYDIISGGSHHGNHAEAEEDAGSVEELGAQHAAGYYEDDGDEEDEDNEERYDEEEEEEEEDAEQDDEVREECEGRYSEEILDNASCDSSSEEEEEIEDEPTEEHMAGDDTESEEDTKHPDLRLRKPKEKSPSDDED